MSDVRNYTLYQPPPPAGALIIGKTLHVHVTKRPRLLTRWLCRLLLQWEWRDASGVSDAGHQTEPPHPPMSDSPP